MIPEEEKRITVEKALAILKEKGVRLCPENAASVVDFMYVLAVMFYQKHK
ncbi:hypothetical protein QG516_21110 [Pedobacter gandavensis]|nr:hypothetical protein [Pedobacter gandavensis]WGQ09013.1 hypothetical protein QG516_21110 [Pedobacter gandavensis]